MRLSLNIRFENNLIPLDYRRLFLSVQKHALETVNKERYLSLYGKGEHGIKPFTFYSYLPQAEFTDESIILSEPCCRLFISTSDYALGIDLYNGLLKMKKEVYPAGKSNSLKIEDISLLNGRTIFSDRVIIKMLSPLVVRKHEKGIKDRYFVFGEDGFDETFKQNILSEMKAFGLEEHEVPELIKIDTKKVVVKSFGTRIPSTLGRFVLKGDKEVLNMLYQCGMGAKRSEGFGAIEIIAE